MCSRAQLHSSLRRSPQRPQRMLWHAPGRTLRQLDARLKAQQLLRPGGHKVAQAGRAQARGREGAAGVVAQRGQHQRAARHARVGRRRRVPFQLAVAPACARRAASAGAAAALARTRARPQRARALSGEAPRSRAGQAALARPGGSAPATRAHLAQPAVRVGCGRGAPGTPYCEPSPSWKLQDDALMPGPSNSSAHSSSSGAAPGGGGRARASARNRPAP